MSGRNYTAGGRSHVILAHLAERNGHIGHLAQSLCYPEPMSENRRKKLWRLLSVLEEDGCVSRDHANWFRILPAGRELLADLRAEFGGDPVRTGEPGARLFVRSAA